MQESQSEAETRTPSWQGQEDIDVTSVLDALRAAQREGRFGVLFPLPAESVSDKHLLRLSMAGVLKTKAKAEVACSRKVPARGESPVCNHNGAPGLDCRNSWCPYAALMRMRLLGRLRRAYALERKKCVGR